MSDTADDPLSLAQLLCTRLCHDLAGPIGAVAAGVELTAGDPAQVDAETLGLIGNSSAAASRKLKFLRIALGVPGSASAVIGELETLVEGYLAATAGRGGPAALAWPRAADLAAFAAALGPMAAPLVLNMCLLVLEAQAACRRVKIEVAATPSARIDAVAEGEPQRAAEWRPEITAALAGEAAEPSAKSIQAHFLKALADRAGGRVMVNAQGSVVRASFLIA